MGVANNQVISQVIPIGLGEFQSLGDRVRHYAAVDAAGKRRRRGCEEEKSGLQKCIGCSMAWYCGKVSEPRTREVGEFGVEVLIPCTFSQDCQTAG